MATKKKEEPKAVTVGGMSVNKVTELFEPNSIMIFGHPKRGKSSMAASIIDVEGFKKVLVIDLERGAKAFARTYPNVDVIEIPQGDVDALDDVVEDLIDNDCYDYEHSPRLANQKVRVRWQARLRRVGRGW